MYRFHLHARIPSLVIALSALGWCGAVSAEDVTYQVDERLASHENAGAAGYGCDKCQYGPCDCAPRMTLFQWSYGTSFGGGAASFDDPLEGDRPDFTEATTTVGLGVAQMEIGYTYTYDNDGVTSTKGQSYPEVLLRYGVFAEWLELRVVWNYADETVGAATNTGSEDIILGFKIALTPQEGILPEMALIPQFTVPTGSAAFTNSDVLPGVIWIYGWELNENWSMAGSSQINTAIDPVSGNEYGEFAQSWVAGTGLSDCVGAYFEWFGLFPTGADTVQPQHYFDGGLT
ncbi:MAG: transporter, partial [Pirellulaceae bacterium]|nr:transporter [Pirellulaceae bacterium]